MSQSSCHMRPDSEDISLSLGNMHSGSKDASSTSHRRCSDSEGLSSMSRQGSRDSEGVSLTSCFNRAGAHDRGSNEKGPLRRRSSLGGTKKTTRRWDVSQTSCHKRPESEDVPPSLRNMRSCSENVSLLPCYNRSGDPGRGI